MKIIVPIEDEMIYQHFGHTPMFRLYEIEENRIIHTQDYLTSGHGHVIMCQMVFDLVATVVIAGGYGMPVQEALASHGVRIFGGVSGNADEAVSAYLNGTLIYNANIAHHCGCHH